MKQNIIGILIGILLFVPWVLTGIAIGIFFSVYNWIYLFIKQDFVNYDNKFIILNRGLFIANDHWIYNQKRLYKRNKR